MTNFLQVWLVELGLACLDRLARWACVGCIMLLLARTMPRHPPRVLGLRR